MRARSAADALAPERKSKRLPGSVVSRYVVVTEFCERLAYYGFAGSLVLLFQRVLGWSNARADTQYALWAGVCYVTPLFGGWAADSYLGRYRAILVFAAIYLTGMVAVTLAAIPGLAENGAAGAVAVLIPMYVIALGGGGIKPNASTFGAEQFDEASPRDRRELKAFWNWFYWSINLGALAAYTGVAYICQFGIGALGGIEWGFAVGFTIPTMAFVVGIAVFTAGSSHYTKKPASGSVVLKFSRIVAQAAWRSLNHRHSAKLVPKEDSRLEGEEIGCTAGAGAASQSCGTKFGATAAIEGNLTGSDEPAAAAAAAAEAATARRGCEVEGDTAASLPGCGKGYTPVAGAKAERGAIWLDAARESHGGGFADRDVDAVGAVWRLMPFLLTLVPFWAVNAQMSTGMQNQACQMDLRVGKSQIPVAALNVANTLGILCLIPVFDRWIYPWFARRGVPLTMLRRIGAGLAMAAAAVLVAAALEVWRKANILDGSDGGEVLYSACYTAPEYPTASVYSSSNRDVSGPAGGWLSLTSAQAAIAARRLAGAGADAPAMPPYASSLSILWQVPQFLLIGMSEILTGVTAMEFFYSQAPPEMKSVSAALNLSTTALGNWLTIPLIFAANHPIGGGGKRKPWLPADLNEGRLELYFVGLAVLLGIALAALVALAQRYEYQEDGGVGAAHHCGAAGEGGILVVDSGPEEGEGSDEAALLPD